MSDEIPTTIGTAFKQALVDAHHETIDHAHEKALEARIAFMETMEVEFAEAFRRMGLIDCDGVCGPDGAKSFLQAVMKPEHPVDFIITGMAIVGAALSGSFAAAAGFNSTLTNDGMRLHGWEASDPLTVATMLARRFITESQADEMFSYRGIKDYNRTATKKLGFNHITPVQALDLWRRGDINEAELDTVCVDNGLHETDIVYLKKFKVGPMDLGTAVAAVTQSQISPTMFAILLEQNGIDPGWADVIFKTAGASPSVQETLELWNRGLINEATVDKIILESPIKNEYVPVLKLMRHRFPALEQTTTLMRRGIMTLEEGKDAIRKLGYTPELADKMATYASTSQSGSARNLTVGQMTRLFEMGRWDAGTFTTRLVAAGFDPDEAADIVDIAEEGKAVARIERGANSIGTRYVSWKIDRQEAVTLLDRINVPTATRDEMLEVWDARREAQTLHLTEAFLHKAHKAGAISREDVERRLLAMGYDAVDTAIIMATDFPAAKITAKQRDLTRADHVKRYEQGLITVNELRDALTTLGYDADEVNQIIELSDKKLGDKAAKETASNGA